MEVSIVPLRIATSNMPIRNKSKAVGAKWNPEKQMWFVSFGKVAGTEFEKHIDVDGFDNNK